MWRRTLAVAAVLAMTFALAPQQPGRAQTEQAEEAAEDAQNTEPAMWAARKASVAENYTHPDANPDNTDQVPRLWGLDFPTEEVGYAVGRHGGDGTDGHRFLLKTEDGGASWFPPGSSLPSTEDDSPISFPTEDVGYIPIGSNGLLRTVDGGASFDKSLTLHNMDPVVSFTTPDLGWTAGSWNCKADCEAPMPKGTDQLLMTTDGGATWEARSASDPSGAHVISTDGGQTWQDKPGTPDGDGDLDAEPGHLEAVGGPAVEDTVLYMTGDGEVYRSDDAGASWTALGLQDDGDGDGGDESIDIVDDSIRALHAVDDEVVFVVAGQGTSFSGAKVSPPVVARTTDGGQTWQDVTPDLARSVPDVAGADAVPPPVVDLRDIAVVPDPNDDGALVGHLVGEVGWRGNTFVGVHPVVFTTGDAGAEEVAWLPEPVDETAFADWRLNKGSVRKGLHGVAVTPYTDTDEDSGEEETRLRSLAVGDSWAIVERTTDPGVDDLQAACLPPGLVQHVDGEEDGQVADGVGQVEEQTGLPVVCEPADEPPPQKPADAPAFTPEPAGPCPVDHPEAGNGPDDPDATFPCVGGDVVFRTESGRPLEFFKPVGYDEALGRFVVTHTTGGSQPPRVGMFDPVDMVQRGVEGFGDGFVGDSAWGHHTGMVSLTESGADLPVRIKARRRAAVMPIEPGRRHSLALVGCGSQVTPPNTTNNCVPASLVTVSLTGQFTVRTAHNFEPVHVGAQPHVISEVLHLTYDETNRVLYVLTEYSPTRNFVPLGEILRSVTEPQQVLHAFDADPADDPGGLRKMWSTAVDPACKNADHENFKSMGITPDGRALAFACQGADVPYFGLVAFTPHGFMRVRLPEGTDPGEMTQADAGRIDQSFYAMPAVIGTNIGGSMHFWTDSSTGLVFWNSPSTVTRVFDLTDDRWIGSFQTPKASGVAVDPDTGRVYIQTTESVFERGVPDDPARVRMAETVNLPVSVRRPVDLATDAPGTWVFVPDADRLLTMDATGVIRVFEDRIPPAQHLGVEDPDAATNDIDESEAAVVRRDGKARGYGSRVWWTGPGTALSGADICFPDEDNCSGRFGHWGWPFTPEESPTAEGRCNAPQQAFVCPGYFPSNIPGMASSRQREAMFGQVSTAELTASTDERESEAVAASQGVDDDTQGDVRRRRLLSEWRRYTNRTVLGPWDDNSTYYRSEPWGDNEGDFDEGRNQMFGHDGWREFERCADEGIDRLWRELDGERRVSPPIDEDGNQPDDCFEQFDEDDPRGADRSSLMEESGAVAASRCHDEDTGNDRERTARGSQVDCDAAGERTVASAELGGFTLRSPEGQQPAGWLTVGSSTSDSTVVRDADRGIVVESTAAARDIEMGMAGQGTVRIGEVRSKAESWAEGRPGTADSWLDVAYEDVQITGEDGKVRFSCGRAEKGDPATPDEDFHHDDGDTTGAHGPCDPDTVVDALNLLFGNKLQATTPARDTADKVAGSPGGARAIVRRDPSAYWSDFVINNFARWEIPALQLTFFNDAEAGPNRMMVDLAGVFTEANYVIGDPLGSYDSGGGTDTGDGDFDPGPATVTVELTDTDGTPLADGQFGLTDHTGAPTGTCTTDDSGACDITGLPAGDYEVSQLSAPAGYLPATDTAPLTLAAGGHATVTFANVWAAGGVTILLTDPAEEPLADGAFELLTAGPDGEATVADTCTTAGDGTCAFPDVPLGDVAVRQTATPAGYQPAEPVAFALTSPGQVARLHVINGPDGAGTSGTRGQVVDDPMPKTERISLASSPPAFTGGTQPQVAEPDGLLGRALVLPGQVAQFALRNPGQALLFTLVWLLVGAPLYLAVRRRELNHIKQWS